MNGPLTPSQTVGPFLAIGLDWADGPEVVPSGSAGAVRISGRVVDGDGDPVADGMVETWQADTAGRFAHPDDPRGDASPAAVPTAPTPTPPGFRGFGRSITDHDGRWHIVTVKPGSLPTADGRVEAPHIDVSVFARGLLDRVVTRIYFPDEADANAADPVLELVDPPRRPALVAVPDGPGLRFDIRLQGDAETPFFDV